jgi:hypothetical protein
VQLAVFPIGRCDGYGLLGVEKMKGPGKTLQTVVVRGMLLLIGRAAIRVMQAKLGERNLVEDRRLRELGSRYRQQQRLHRQSIDRNRADQPSPELPQFQTCLIWSASHAHKLILLYRVRDGKLI